MRSAISERGGNSSRAGEGWKVWRSLRARKRKPDTSQGGPEATNLRFSGGQGVHREVESEGHEEQYRAVIDGATPKMNRSAKGGARSSLHYEGEGALIHPANQKLAEETLCELGPKDLISFIIGVFFIRAG